MHCGQGDTAAGQIPSTAGDGGSASIFSCDRPARGAVRGEKRIPMRIAVMACVALLFACRWAAAADDAWSKPSKTDKCPVCGMFVYKYPDWTAGIVFKDGHTVFFDGAKDMFKYYFDMGKYASGKTRGQIREIRVTEYYDMRWLDARSAFFVTGSDVYGPMGRELIPLASGKDAETFRKDHHGRLILTFDRVTPAVIRNLDD